MIILWDSSRVPLININSSPIEIIKLTQYINDDHFGINFSTPIVQYNPLTSRSEYTH